MKQRLVVFDLETSSLDESTGEVSQFAAIAVDHNWRELESIELKVKIDESKADPGALAINGYDPARWALEARSPAAAMGGIADFMRRHAGVQKVSKAGNPYTIARLCGHNAAGFDGRFLAAWFKRANQFLPGACFECLDTLALARWVTYCHPCPPADQKLGTLCRWLGIEHTEEHDALGDVRATAELARRLVSLAGMQVSAA